CDLALLDYNQAIERLSTRVPSYMGRARCYIEVNMPEEARADLDRVVTLDANNEDGLKVVALSVKARLDMSAGDSEAALKNLDAAIALDGRRSALYIERGLVWSNKGDLDKALADYDQAIKDDENNSGGFALSARVLKARMRTSMGEIDAAIGEYDEAIKIAPT